MIYRLTYCNKDGVEARVDIQKGLATPVIDVEGTERPFILSYNNDKGDKSGMFLSSSADIEIYETTDFNIDNLKTSNETELAVTYYINNIVKWKGFIIPDFFSIEVRSNPVILMTASDRLGTLKNVTLSDLPSMVNIRELAVSCLNKTGLELPLKTMADFSNDGTNNAFFSYYIDSQRIKDVKGRSISCYDILSSILIVSRSKLVQRAGEWVIINKLQHEIGSGKIYSSLSSFTNYLENIYNFEEVSIGARRTIMPVAGSVGVYHEHGGRKSHPANYDFSLDLSGWNSVNGFVATIENRHITGFLGGTPFFDPERTVKQYLLNYNNWIDNTNNLNTAPYITTDAIPINSPRADRVEVTVDISSTMAEKLSSNTAISFLRYAVILTNGVKTYTLTKAGIFEILDPENISGHSLLLRGGQQHPLILASPAFSNSDSFKGLFEVGEDDDVNNYSATIRVYGSGDQYVTVNYALIKFSDVSELPKGTMYKTEQGEVFTKAYDIETSIFGDYLLSGLDGYFYRYPNDDTSSIYKDVNTLSTPVWTTPSIPNETSELPILHHSMRQMRRMFSVAHDLLSAEIEVNDFDPLAIFVACEKRYTVVSAQFDFFKSNLSVELEEVAFQNNVIREYIYSYFGDGETGVKSIGGISSGASGSTGIDPGLIGGINERIDDVDDKVNNIKVGPANLLLNTGFLGDFQSLTVDALTAVTGSTPINTNPLVHWVYSNTEVIDAPSRSGKGVKIGSIQQTVNLKQGSHVLSFWAKGNSLTVDLVESVPVSIDSEYKKYSFDITVANSGAYTLTLSDDAYIYEIMLSEGNAEVSYSYSEEDDLKAIAQLQAINVITDAIKNYDTDILGGLILTTMIQLGKYKDGVMEKVNAGISGIYNNDNDPAVWAGGTMEMAIRTVQKFLANPNYQPTEEEWAEMAKIVFTHGGDGFFRGYIYALGGIFRGRIESNVSGNRITINPENRSLEMINSQNRLSGQIFFSEGSGWGAVQFYDYHANGTLKTVAALDLINGVYFSEYADGNPVPVKITYSKNGQIQNGGIPSMTDAQADTLLVSGEWYRDGRTLKIKP